jgi:hypothetical protein
VPTLHRVISVLEFLIERWTNMSQLARFAELKDALDAGLANLQKWYWDVDSNNAYFISLGALTTICTRFYVDTTSSSFAIV